MTNRVIVIGGGPAGMMAAGRVAECGARVVLLEKGPRLGRKLRISGKGRGNITNTADIDEFVEAFAPNGKFLYGAFSRFFRDDLIELLRGLGVETKVERGGRVFPVSDRADDVADALEHWIRDLGVVVKYDMAVRSLEVEGGDDRPCFRQFACNLEEQQNTGRWVSGVKVFGGRMDAGAVIIATGGLSYPKTGSTGDGYALAREAGHTIMPLKPALSALYAREEWVQELQGLTLKNVAAALIADPGDSGKPRVVASEFGEMLFTHFGVSGPIILTLSRGVDRLLDEGRVLVSINLKPAPTREELHARLIRDFKGAKRLKNYLPELLPRLMIGPFMELAALDPEKPVNSVTAEERTRIVELLKDLRVTVERMGPIEEAIVTSGGVSVKEIDPRTMMSKLIDGLFFAGEVIDVDGRTGGFNLQAAFSTGYVAGESASDYVRRSAK